MKKKLIVAGTVWMLALAAAEPIALDPFPQWKMPQGWSATPEQLECRFTGWSAVTMNLKIPKAGICRLEFRYRTPGGSGAPLKVRIDKETVAAYPATEEWSSAVCYFRADGPCPLTLIAEGKSPYTLQIGAPRLELLAEADCRKFRLDAGKGVAGFRTMKGEAHRIVPTDDHIEEGMAFLSRGKEARELRSVELPVQPGRHNAVCQAPDALLHRPVGGLFTFCHLCIVIGFHSPAPHFFAVFIINNIRRHSNQFTIDLPDFSFTMVTASHPADNGAGRY